MRRPFVATAALALSVLFGELVPARVPSPANGNKKFEVWVVAGGANKSRSSSPEQADLRAGYDMLQGAHQAHASDYFTVESFDDENNIGKAVEQAYTLRKDPKVLAVVGHGTTMATQAAAWIYATAQIPLIIPVATASATSYLDGRPEEPRFKLGNTFRLPPNDTDSQAPILARMIDVIATPTADVHIVQEDTGPYARSIVNKIKLLLRNAPYGEPKQELVSKDNTVAQIVKNIQADHVAEPGRQHLILFVGYPQNAADLVSTISSYYRDSKGAAPPTLLFSEAAEGIERVSQGLPIFRTSYFDPHSSSCTFPKKISGRDDVSAAQLYGFDAISILDQAAKQCARVDRLCLLDKLRQMPAFGGACGGYSFSNGDSRSSNYYIFASAEAVQSNDYKLLSAEFVPQSKSNTLVVPPQKLLQLNARFMNGANH